jgi:hypothetical protein
MFVSIALAIVLSYRLIRTGHVRTDQASVFAVDTIDVGEILRDTNVTCEFPLRSSTRVQLKNAKITCSCGCLQPHPPMSRALKVSFDSYRRLGVFRNSCNVSIDGRTIGVLSIKGTVVPELEVYPEKVEFSRLSAGGKNQNLLSLRRVGLEPEKFHRMRFRFSSAVLEMSELTRDADKIVLEFGVTKGNTIEIERGIFCEWIDEFGVPHTVAHVPCIWAGIRMVPSSGVILAETKRNEETHVFKFVSADRMKIHHLEIEDVTPNDFLEIQFENNLGEYPVVTLKLHGLVPAGERIVRVYYTEDGCIRWLALPLRFV